MDIYSNHRIKTGYLDIKAICINYCTDEVKYLDPNSHFIHIPRIIYHSFLEIKDKQGKGDKPLYVGIRHTVNKDKRLCFGRVEPSVNTPNSTHDDILLPEWAIKKLGLDGLSDVVDLVYIVQPKTISYLKIRGNNSSYVKHPNIKLVLEEKLSNCNCLNLGETFTIEDVIFTITEIKDKDNKILEYGAIFDSEVNLDFDLPDDLVELEKKKVEERILQKSNEQNNIKYNTNKNVLKKDSLKYKYGARIHGINEEEKEETKSNEIFSGPGIKLENGPIKKLTKEEILEMRMRKLNLDS